MEQNKDRNKEKFDVDVDGILRMQYNRDLKRKRDKINAKKKEALEEQARKKARKKIIRTGIFVLAFGASLGLNAKNVIEKQNQKNAINKAFEPIKEEAQSIISNNDNINADGTIKLGNGEFVYQYYHGGIASDLKERLEETDELTGDALVAAVLHLSENNAYNNDNRIISNLTGQGLEEFLAEKGYETAEDFYDATKLKYYLESEEQKVIEAYQNQEEQEEGLKK